VFGQDKQQLADGSYESRGSNYELEDQAIKAIHNPRPRRSLRWFDCPGTVAGFHFRVPTVIRASEKAFATSPRLPTPSKTVMLGRAINSYGRRISEPPAAPHEACAHACKERHKQTAENRK